MKVSHGKNDPSIALYCINRFELSEVTLSFVEWCIHFGNGTCHLQVFTPHKNPPFSNPNIAGLSVTHFCQLCSPAITISNTSVHPIRASHSKLQRNSRYSSKGEWSYLLKKKEKEKSTLNFKLQIMEFK